MLILYNVLMESIILTPVICHVPEVIATMGGGLVAARLMNITGTVYGDQGCS